MMNKDWVRWPRGGVPYQDAVKKFVHLACEKLGNPSKLSCPCVDCKNLAAPLPPKTVHLHLLQRGMDQTYTEWVLHGEKVSTFNDVHEEGETRQRTFYQMWTDANVEGDAEQGQGVAEPRQDDR
ncbi:hypothetical protein MKW94_005373 [Papaver nudicaule]|uniref:Transposase-associated domain-containing protein n=1 Tax=Papaver nudicaule TaxID=74823 RepID=A0AA41S7C8_PAPNU|nr:hypothetical protein [Papaver nudicaule]